MSKKFRCQRFFGRILCNFYIELKYGKNWLWMGSNGAGSTPRQQVSRSWSAFRGQVCAVDAHSVNCPVFTKFWKTEIIAWEIIARMSRRRSPADLWAFARAWIVLLAADLSLRALSYPRVERLFAPGTGGRANGEEEVARLAWAVSAAARRHLYPMRCLPRALCLRWLLGRRGFPSELRIGVAREEGVLLAHAWVEREGRPVGEEGVAERFAALGPTP